jgi:hypothetical protein
MCTANRAKQAEKKTLPTRITAHPGRQLTFGAAGDLLPPLDGLH